MPLRRRRPRGHIEQLPSGKYRARVYAGRDPLTNKERYLLETAPDYEAAQKAATRLQRQVDEDQHPKSAITVREAIEQRIEVAALEDTTRERYDDLIRLYILPTFGHLQATKLDAELLERFYARLHRCRDLCTGRPRAGHTCRPLSTSTTRKVPGAGLSPCCPAPAARTAGSRDWAQTHRPQWTEALRLPAARLGEPEQVYSTFPAPLPSAEGYRIIWVHSIGKAARDAAARQARIEAGAAAIDALATRLAGPKCRLKTRVAVADEAAAALARAGADRWISYSVGETVTETFRQERRGRPGKDTRYRRHTTTRHTISWDTRLDVLAYDAATDGCFPLITNDTTMTDADVLGAYRYQPNLERRHHLLKSMQDAAPLLLRSPARIEGLFCLPVPRAAARRAD